MPFRGFASFASYTRARYRTLIVSAFSMAFAAFAINNTRASAQGVDVSTTTRLEKTAASIRARDRKAKANLNALIAAEPDGQERTKLAALLWQLPAQDATVSDYDAALADADARVRLTAVVGLGKRAGAAAAARLEKLLASDPVSGVREAAAFWLGQPGRESSAPALGAALTQDKDPQVRVQAAQALSRLGTTQALGLLHRGAKDSDERVKKWAR